MKKILTGLLVLMLLAVLSGCTSGQAEAGNLLSEVKQKQQTANFAADGTEAPAVYDFAVKLLQQSWQEQETPTENMLLSPVSALLALTMTANGAEGDTLAQMETAFGLPLPRLNGYLQAYVNALPQTEHSSLSVANSIWLKDDENLLVQPDFLQTNAAYYGAAVYREPFDEATVAKINAWVRRHTEGMVDGILTEIPPEALMYLINALAFDAAWEEPYREWQVQPDMFTKEDGSQSEVNFMYSTEPVYLQDENTVGFIKYYDGRDYALVALLPAAGIRLDDYVAGLSGEKLANLLQSAEEQEVYASIPKFTVDYEQKLNDVLQNMGIVDAFDAGLADFSGMAACADGQNIFISMVLQKTHIEIDEQGTKAAAVTAVGLESGGMPPDNPEVYLNRPFVYLLIDCREELPLFIGALGSPE